MMTRKMIERCEQVAPDRWNYESSYSAYCPDIEGYKYLVGGDQDWHFPTKIWETSCAISRIIKSRNLSVSLSYF